MAQQNDDDKKPHHTIEDVQHEIRKWPLKKQIQSIKNVLDANNDNIMKEFDSVKTIYVEISRIIVELTDIIKQQKEQIKNRVYKENSEEKRKNMINDRIVNKDLLDKTYQLSFRLAPILDKLKLNNDYKNK